ncbi:beta-lactamase family protein [Dyadobacter sp. CY345]|uniref:serine hydrolase domain-containing protein n=1 Tax=Dyadobacter sp. CY345 TaxID=2909335 RepID=UPI001F3A3265|nr:serine hydrolase domain-containing protein [Dyadobacter sp. CY345]MCF2443192.1 beta-lactamase family protein [Dyadobacter sp. CY345]
MSPILSFLKQNAVQVLIGSILLSGSFLNAQILVEVKPETVGLSIERLKRVDKVLQEYVDKQEVAGAVALIVKDGKIVYQKGFGLDDVSSKTPLKQDAIFRIASQTKAITSTAVMILYEEGKFLLDDPVSKYITEFKNPKILDKFNETDSSFTTKPAKREITIRDLLTHTSGISYPLIGSKEAKAIYAKNNIPSGIGTPDYVLADVIKRLGGMPLIHEPGERFSYGLNTDVLGYLVEVVSGKSLNDFFKERIFEPLGMKDTYFYLPENKKNRLAKLYTEDDNGKTIVPENSPGFNNDYPKVNGKFYAGGAGLTSTAYDYAIFLQTMLNGGEYNGKRILSPAVVNLMTRNQIGDLNQGRNKFGLGFSIASSKEAARIPIPENTFEWGGIFGTTYWADPKNKIVGLLMTQEYPNSSWGEMQDKFKVLVYQSLVK